MLTLDEDIQKIFQEAGEENAPVELTHDQLWRLILCECEEGEVTVEELLEIRKTGLWPEGKCNVFAADAELLLGMLPKDFINSRLS